jgi:hypothetical protein
VSRGRRGEALKGARAWRCGEDAVFPFSVPTKQKCLVGEMLGIQGIGDMKRREAMNIDEISRAKAHLNSSLSNKHIKISAR